jgi:hypothetical protein
MKKLFGYTIPFKRLDKSFKACYRYSKYDACITDQSFFNTIIIKNNVYPILSKIKNNILPEININSSNTNVFKTNLYNTENGLIGPIDLLLFNANLIIFYHSVFHDEIFTLFNFVLKEHCNEDIVFCGRVFNKFNLIGPQASNVNLFY